MDKRQGNLDFRVMSWIFKVRDKLKPPKEILLNAGIKPGHMVLDYGCGPGSFSLAAAEIVGPEGEIAAIDMHPLAIQMVDREISRKGLSNIRTVLADSPGDLKSGYFDVVILYDIFHGFREPEKILKELRRVIKPDGFLTFSDHHMKRNAIIDRITGSGMFRLEDEQKKIFRFLPA